MDNANEYRKPVEYKTEKPEEKKQKRYKKNARKQIKEKKRKIIHPKGDRYKGLPRASKESMRNYYRRYMKSSLWSLVRSQVIDARGDKCEICDEPGEVMVRWWYETPYGTEDLQSICHMCRNCQQEYMERYHHDRNVMQNNPMLRKDKKKEIIEEMQDRELFRLSRLENMNIE